MINKFFRWLCKKPNRLVQREVGWGKEIEIFPTDPVVLVLAIQENNKCVREFAGDIPPRLRPAFDANFAAIRRALTYNLR